MDLSNIVARAQQVIDPDKYEADLQMRVQAARREFADFALKHGKCKWLHAMIEGTIANHVIMQCVEHIRDNDLNWTLRKDEHAWLYDGTPNLDRWRFTYCKMRIGDDSDDVLTIKDGANQTHPTLPATASPFKNLSL